MIGLLLTLAAGTTWGPVMSLSVFSAFVVTHNAYGPDLAWHALATGNRWHTNLWVDGAALVAAAWFTYRLAGVPWQEPM